MLQVVGEKPAMCFQCEKNWASAEDTRDTEGNIGGLEGVLMTAVWYHAFENAVMCVINPPTANIGFDTLLGTIISVSPDGV